MKTALKCLVVRFLILLSPVLGTVKGGDLTGQALDAVLASGVRAVTVRLVPVDSHAAESNAATDSHGNYAIRNVKPGTYQLIFSKLNYFTSPVKTIVTFSNELSQPTILKQDTKVYPINPDQAFYAKLADAIKKKAQTSGSSKDSYDRQWAEIERSELPPQFKNALALELQRADLVNVSKIAGIMAVARPKPDSGLAPLFPVEFKYEGLDAHVSPTKQNTHFRYDSVADLYRVPDKTTDQFFRTTEARVQ